MNNIDKGLIAMRISYNTKNLPALHYALKELVRSGCSADEIFENCPSEAMRTAIAQLIRELGLKPIVIT